MSPIRSLVGSCLLGLVLPACGSQTEAPAPAAQWRACDSAAFAEAAGQVAEVEVPGEDAPVVVKLVDGSGPCAGGLVARYGTGVAGLDVSGLDLDPASAEIVTLTDGQKLLRVDSAGHPRGGFQPHLFAVAAGMAEVGVDGAPLLPFVATDGGAAPTAARCGPGGTVELLRAATSEPPGVVLAWDVHRTTYEVDGAHAEKAGSDQLHDHIADPMLREQMPELFEPEGLLGDCGR
jgi:hypothetical protein